MRKIINKLFEWLGYVPKVEFAKIKEEYMMLKKYRYLKSSILANEVRYKIGETSKYFVVYTTNRDVNYPIKVFYIIDDDKDYAKLCAEELCEMLNQKI
jgi:hypothetical protein